MFQRWFKLLVVFLVFWQIIIPAHAQEESETYYQQGLEHFANQAFDQALTAFTEAIELQPTVSKYYVARGQVYLETGVLAPAIRDFDTAIAQDETNALAFWYRSDAYYQLGDLEKAAEDYTHATEIDPSYHDFYEQLAFNYARIGDTAQYLANRTHAIDLKYRHVSVQNMQYRLEIKRILEVTSATGFNPGNGVFLILEINLYNYTSEPVCFGKQAIKATYDEITVEPTKMSQVQQQYYPNKGYLPGEKPHCIDRYQMFDTFLVYDVPSGLPALTLDFRPTETTQLKFSLWMNKEPEQADYVFALAQLDGQDYIEIVNVEAVETIGKVIESYPLSIENCFGTADRISQVAYTQQEENLTGQETVNTYHAGLGLPIPVPYLRNLLQAELSLGRQMSSIDGEIYSLTVTMVEQVGAAPGTHSNYQITWVSVNANGTVEVKIGDNTFFVPFSVENRIRGKVETLPPTPCN